MDLCKRVEHWYARWVRSLRKPFLRHIVTSASSVLTSSKKVSRETDG